ncbi:hypothetical protein J4E82_009944 [Alternaria postmessia]|uniref:uncharacterized protein n=1 Tax=Alternaria postmessia TaxID=1187938 RepID=UPI0022250FA3|nr:uncharacterized protein J4E82_009944 [Alternaria postmessia]KAI5371359.1 hypothetical protein J4E82_009944 [Alternaria postmessia]
MENPEAACRVLCTHFTLDTRRLLPILSLLPVSAASAQPPAFCNSSTSPVVIGSIRYRLDTLSRIISGSPSKSGNHTIASPIWNWWGLTRCCIQPSDRDRAVSQPPSNQEKDRPCSAVQQLQLYNLLHWDDCVNADLPSHVYQFTFKHPHPAECARCGEHLTVVPILSFALPQLYRKMRNAMQLDGFGSNRRSTCRSRRNYHHHRPPLDAMHCDGNVAVVPPTPSATVRPNRSSL